MSGNVLSRWRMIAILVSSILLSPLCFGLVMTTGHGTWPADWPKELESYREQAKTIGIAAGNQEDVFEISFRSREQFEKIWPVIQTLKSEGAPLTLITAGSAPGWAGLFDNNEPVLRIYAPSYTTGAVKTPDGKTVRRPVPPWPDSAKLPNGQLPKYVWLSDDKTTWVPADTNHNPLKGFKGFEYRARIEIEIVVDGKIIDLNRIRLPVDTPIIDRRICEHTNSTATDVNKE
jgi:hypothetical protein